MTSPEGQTPAQEEATTDLQQTAEDAAAIAEEDARQQIDRP